MQKIAQRLRLPFQIEALPLALAAILAGAVWVFLEVADEVIEGEARAIDRMILLAFRSRDDPRDPLGPLWIEEMARDITALGSVTILVTATMVAFVYLLLARKTRPAFFVAAAVISGQILSSSLKFGFDRPRPDLVPHEMAVYTASFPSGHSMMSAVTFLTLAALLARVQPKRRLKVFTLIVAVLLVIFVGISRVYLGVHWPTDVLAGWSVGAGWAVAWWLGAWVLQRRGKMERTAEE